MKALEKQIKAMSIKALAKHIGLNEQTVYKRIKEDKIPRRHRRAIVERLEGIDDDNMILADKLMECLPHK